ncbi:hypothetical protein [Mesorhizobium sp. M0130]
MLTKDRQRPPNSQIDDLVPWAILTCETPSRAAASGMVSHSPFLSEDR